MVKRVKKTFTLIELLVVVAIIGILAVAILVNINISRKKARDARIKNSMQHINKIGAIWQDDHAQNFGTDFCEKNDNLDTIKKDISNNGGNLLCQADDKKYAASSPLNTGGSWCVDSSLYSGYGYIVDLSCQRQDEVGAIGSGDHFELTGLYGASEYDVAKNTGAKWVRPEITWDQIQDPKTKEFRWSQLDAALAEANSRGLKVMLSLRTKQNPAFTDCESVKYLCSGKKECPDSYASCPPKNIDPAEGAKRYYPDYYDLVYNLVDHFKGKIDYYIIENEVNTTTFWNGTSDQYRKLRATAYKAAHAVSGANPVVVDNGIASEAWVEAIAREKFCECSTCSNEKRVDDAVKFLYPIVHRNYSESELYDFVTKQPIPFGCNAKGNPVMDRGSQITVNNFIDKTYDMMSYHYYEDWKYQKVVIDWIKKKMASNNNVKPIINSEGGYYSIHESALDSSVQSIVAKDVIKMHVIAYASGVGKFTWLELVQKQKLPPVPAEIYNYYKGLYQQGSPPTRLAAGLAYETMIKKIGSFSAAEALSSPSEVYVYRFIQNGKTILVIWSENSMSNYDVSSFINNPKKITHNNGKEEDISGTKVNLSDEPIFIEN